MDQTLVSSKYQIVIPKAVRRELKVQPGQKMNVNVSGEQIILSKAKHAKKMAWPQDYLNRLKNPWEGQNPQEYLDEERSSWE